MSTTTTATEISGGGGGGSPTGAAGGDLGGTYPNPTVDDDGHAHTAATVTLAAADVGAAPSTVDYLVGTASGGLSAEIVVGTTPGGELGGTWASPTVDGTHSGSSHAGIQSAAEATAAGYVATHEADTTAVHGITDTSTLVLTGDSRLSDSRAPTGSAGGDLSGTYPNPSVSDDSHAHTSSTVTPAGIGAAPASVDYLVGTASGGLSGEIVVGTSPGGELGGTWASPTVDATHSGSAHHTQSHDHSAAGDGTSLSPATLVLPAATSPAQTAEGSAVWDSDDDILTVGDGSSRKTFGKLGSTAAVTQAFADSAASGSSVEASRVDHKHAMPTLGYGLSDNSAPAVGLTTASGICTAETSISAATYADVTGASVSLAAGTWLLIADVYGRIVNARAQMNVAITDGSNNIVREGTGDIPASGAANVNASGHVGVTAIVSPGSTTTYKIRAARGNTTNTGTWTAMDGAATGTTNNASDNSDKATGILAIRIA